MVKFRRLKSRDKSDALYRWLAYFDVHTSLEELEEVIKMDPGISKAEERLRFVTQDKDFLRQYHIRQMELSDWTTGVNTAFEKGIEKGSNAKSLDIAKKALAEDLPVKVIQKITGLSLEDLQALQTEQ
jgi:predicted transposase/invertase (TIGR01784 family)